MACMRLAENLQASYFLFSLRLRIAAFFRMAGEIRRNISVNRMDDVGRFLLA